MFSSKCNLQFKKRKNEYSNSTESCRIDVNRGLAYSYGQVISIFKNGIVIFNWRKFSQTTTIHQRSIYSHYRKTLFKIISVDVPSLNNFVGREIDDDFFKDLIRCAENIELIESCEKFKKFPDLVLNRIDELQEIEKENKRIQSIHRISYKVENLQYSSEKTLLKAISKINKAKNSFKPRFDKNKLDVNKIKKFKKIIMDYFYVTTDDREYIEKITAPLIFNDLGD